MTTTERRAAKDFIDRIMGDRAGDGVSPATASSMLAESLGIALSPRQVWNLWIDGDEE